MAEMAEMAEETVVTGNFYQRWAADPAAAADSLRRYMQGPGPVRWLKMTTGMLLAVGLHRPACLFRKQATNPFPLKCGHGFQACPVCDPCECGAVDGPLDDGLVPVE